MYSVEKGWILSTIPDVAFVCLFSITGFLSKARTTGGIQCHILCLVELRECTKVVVTCRWSSHPGVVS